MRVNRIGHMAQNQEEFCCELDLGMRPKEFRILVHRDKPCNTALLDIQKRILPIHNAFLPLFDVCHKLGGLGISSMALERCEGSDWRQLVTKTEQHLHFSQKETEEAKRQCADLGIEPGVPFVPVLSRDTSYLKLIDEPTDQNSYRNDDINTYLPALEHLAEEWKVVRMGSMVKKALNTNNPNIIDYATSGCRSELLDVYLSGSCKFFMSCATGLDAIASHCFRRPVLYVNFLPPMYAPLIKPGSIVIPQKYWHTKKERYLTLSELIETGGWAKATPAELDPLDIVVHKNTPEEILAGAVEMKARLEGTWVETPEDKQRQEQFWSIFKKNSDKFNCVGLVGANFLKENPNWLE